MSAKTLLLLVEGPHDLEFCARLLKPKGFSRIQSFAVLQRAHPFWRRTVPEKWPHADDLLARHPVPLFLAHPAGQSVAIVNATGISKLAKGLGLTLSNLDVSPDAFGVILDADDTAAPQKRFDDLCAEIGRLPEPAARTLRWPTTPGAVNPGPPSTGIFVLPDNQSLGTLEDLLLEAAGCTYPQLLQAAQGYVASAGQDPALQPDDLEEFRKPAGSKKATAAAMASILKPGKSIQVSIQDNRWLEAAALNLPRIKAVADFLDALLT